MEVVGTREQLPDEEGPGHHPVGPSRQRIRAGAIAELLAVALPLIGLGSLLLRSQLDPHFENYRVHFVLFGLVGTIAFVLGFAAGEAANRRGDARVLLLSLAFMATGGFMGLHALGTRGVLFSGDHAGFKVAIPVGLLVSAGFAAASAFVDVRPEFARLAIRHRRVLRATVLAAMGGWFVLTVLNLPPLDGPDSETARGALIGVAVTGERKWHASWWEWHFLIVTAYLIIGFAAQRQWRDERFRDLYLTSTREREQDVSVLFSDLVGYTTFAERSSPAQAAAVLQAYWGTAAPLLTRQFGGEVEKFIGDGVVAVFNRTGDQPDHARRAACAALALQRAFADLADAHPEWPRMRVGVNSGEAVVREIGGEGHVAYPMVGDTINTGARLEGLAPVGGVLIGAETFERLPDGAVVEPRAGLRVKGKDVAIDAYVLHALPC
jgi:adenylate cyclase